MRAIRVAEKSADSDNLLVDLTEVETPKIMDGECLIDGRAGREKYAQPHAARSTMSRGPATR